MAQTGIRTLVLSGSEIARVREAGGPLADNPEWVAHLQAQNDVVAVERDGRIVAYWPIWLAVHAEPLWAAPDARGPGVIRALVQGLFDHLHAAGVGSAFVVLGTQDQRMTLAPAIKLGFERVPGDLYHLDVARVARRKEGDTP